jgi:hypothetical protein
MYVQNSVSQHFVNNLENEAEFINWRIKGHAYPDAYKDYFLKSKSKPFWCTPTSNIHPKNSCKESLL